LEIKWTDPADEDLNEIEAFVTENLPTGAIKLILILLITQRF